MLFSSYQIIFAHDLRLKIKFNHHTTSLYLVLVFRISKYCSVTIGRVPFVFVQRSLKFQKHYMVFNELMSDFPAADVTRNFISYFPLIPPFQLFCVFSLEKMMKSLVSTVTTPCRHFFLSVLFRLQRCSVFCFFRNFFSVSLVL